MIDLNRNINSLSNSQRNTPEFLRQLKESGHPVVLTISRTKRFQPRRSNRQ